MTIEKKIITVLRQSPDIKKGSKILIGVSGGIDSIVLTHIMSKIRHHIGVSISIAHFNHALRESANEDEAFVIQYARKLNLPIIVKKHAPTKPKKNISENQARIWRYEFFQSAMCQSKANFLMLAHHQSDLAETVLMRILRGSGLNGLKGILPQKTFGSMLILRPMLAISRAEIMGYAKLNKLKFCHDETNDSDKYLRNKVRHKLIPYLQQEYNPNIESALVQLSKIAGDDYLFLYGYAWECLKENIVIAKRRVKIRQSFFKLNHVSVVRLGLRIAVEKLLGENVVLEFQHITNILKWISDTKSKKVLIGPQQLRLCKIKTGIELHI